MRREGDEHEKAGRLERVCDYPVVAVARMAARMLNTDNETGQHQVMVTGKLARSGQRSGEEQPSGTARAPSVTHNQVHTVYRYDAREDPDRRW
jgi:hypothetical protein